MQTICSYEWDDVDAGVLCRYLGMGMSGRATLSITPILKSKEMSGELDNKVF
jgi:hypothetical protein